MSDACLSSWDLTTCVHWDGVVFTGLVNRFEAYPSSVAVGSIPDPPIRSLSFLFLLDLI